MPLLFKAVARFERYDTPTMAASITLARSFVTKIAAIYIIVVALYIAHRFDYAGWEYAVGQNFYQLVWTNFAFSALSTVFFGIFGVLVRGRGGYEFQLADNTLEVIYEQALVWIGVVYAPVVILISLVTGAALFFVKKFTLTTFGKPPRRVYNSYSQNIYFLLFLLLTLGLMAFPTFFSITQFKPTSGPYAPVVSATRANYTLAAIYQIIPDGIAEINSQFLRDAFSFLGSIGFVGPVICVLSLWIYYLRALNLKRLRKTQKLAREVRAERADKKFLLKYYKVK